ncbi:hypothetical protein FRC07_006205 [Ceratobasidium sp. 392]|nr:hypothetical protein FRC07_006205 [Ceratobasidium sp. 392]
MTEDGVANGIYSCLITTLQDSKNNGLLESADQTSGEEEQLVVRGLALLLLYAAKSETTSPSIPLPCPEDSDRRLYASNCPATFRPYFDRWAGLVPRLRYLPQGHTQDLVLLICRKPLITLPRDIPDPFPFFPTPEQQARKKIRDLSSKLSTISHAISAHASFLSLWRGKTWAGLGEESGLSSPNQVPDVITSSMPFSANINGQVARWEGGCDRDPKEHY